MIQEHEQNIIESPVEFRDNYKPVPKPRTIKCKPIPAPRKKLTPIKQALKDSVKTYEIDLKNKNDPLSQLQTARQTIERYFNESYLKIIKILNFMNL